MMLHHFNRTNYDFRHINNQSTLVYLRPRMASPVQQQHVTRMQLMSVPFVHRARDGKDEPHHNVLLATSSSTIADWWDASCAMQLQDACQVATLMHLPLVVVTNMYCDLATKQLHYELCYSRS